MIKKKGLILSAAALLLALTVFCIWFFGAGRTLTRAEKLLEQGDAPAAVALIDKVADSNATKTLYRCAVLYSKAKAHTGLETVTQELVKHSPDDSRTYAARLLLDWALSVGNRDAIYAEADAKGIDLSDVAPHAPATKEADGAVLAPLTEVELFPYRSDETVYLEINGDAANCHSPIYTLPLVAVFGDYPISAVSLNADGVPSRTFTRTLHVTETTSVGFADPTFEAVVLGTLQETEYREVTNRELREMDELILNAMVGEAFFADEFKSFYDLRYFAHLKTLGISQDEDLQDLSPLRGLYGLKRFSLYGPLADNLEHVAALRSLISLSLERPMIDHLAVISDMPALTTLRITAGDISDLSELKNHTGLTALQLDYQKISDLTPLSALTNLETLNLYDNEITDISPLNGLSRLKHLDLRNNPVDNGADLALPRMETFLKGE